MESLKKKHPEHFFDAQVLEIGSYNMNGSAREFFVTPKRYVGVDLISGPGVDIVCKADATSFEPNSFDTLVYLSVFEHDPKWAVGFEHNLEWVRPGGLIIICWGAEGNNRHLPEPWAPVPVKDFMEAAKRWPMEIIDSFFEAERFDPLPGAYDVLARKR